VQSFLVVSPPLADRRPDRGGEPAADLGGVHLAGAEAAGQDEGEEVSSTGSYRPIRKCLAC
jgi:hypothetical protein